MSARRILSALAILALVAFGIYAALHWWIADWFWHPLGTCTPKPNCLGYQLWSGSASDIGEITILTGAIIWWRHANCHTKGCWRLGKHPVEGTPYKVCRKCHPLVPDHGATREEIHQAHRHRSK